MFKAFRIGIYALLGLSALGIGGWFGLSYYRSTATVPGVASRSTAAQQPELHLISTSGQAAALQPPRAKPEIDIRNWKAVEARLKSDRETLKVNENGYFALPNTYHWAVEPEYQQMAGYAEVIDVLEGHLDEHPDSASLRIALAKAYVYWGAEARGDGWASSVTEEGWRLLHERVEKAYALLEEAEALKPSDPQLFAEFVQVAMYKSDIPKEQVYRWVAEGRKLAPTYYPLYMAMADYLLPRWHGEPGDVEQFAASLVELIPGDDGLEAYARVVMEVKAYESSSDNTLVWGSFDKKLLSQGAEVLARRYPQSQRMVSFAANCVFVAQDREAAQRILPLLGKYDPKQSYLPGENAYKAFRQWCAALEIPTGEDSRVWASYFGSGSPPTFDVDSRYLWNAQAGGCYLATLIDSETGFLQSKLDTPAWRLGVYEMEFDTKRRLVIASVGTPESSESKMQRSMQKALRMLSPTKSQETSKSDGENALAIWSMDEPGSPALIPIGGYCQGLAMHPTEPVLAWTEEETVHTINLETGERGLNVKTPSNPHDVWFSADGESLIVSNNWLTVWDLATGQMRYEVKDGTEYLGTDLQDNMYILTQDKNAQTNLVRVSPDGKQRDILVQGLGGETPVSRGGVLSPDFKYLAVPEKAKDDQHPGRIHLFDVSTGKLVLTLPGHWSQVYRLNFSNDGMKLASLAMHDPYAKIWDLQGKLEAKN